MRSHPRLAFARLFSSALLSQALLSLTSLGVGLLLIRHTDDLEYGRYILATGAIMLMASLQNAFIVPAMVSRIVQRSAAECGDLIGGLYREQRVLVLIGAGLSLLLCVALAVCNVVDGRTLMLLTASVLAIVAALRREYFRTVLLAYRDAHTVLRGDLFYALALSAGVLLALVSPMPGTTAVIALGIAAALSSGQLSRLLRQGHAWNGRGAPGILRQIAPLASWSTAGAGIHWTFSQGYTVLVAAMLDVRAIAAIAATRLLAMPVNLLSSGIGSLMLPLVARWMLQLGVPAVFRRLIWCALGVGLAAVAYFSLLWVLRDLVFEHLLHKRFAQRDLLLMLWSATFVTMAVHQQLIYLLVARQCFRQLTALALISAVAATGASYAAILRFGGAGAPLGILVGESITALGVLMLCLGQLRPARAASATVAPDTDLPASVTVR